MKLDEAFSELDRLHEALKNYCPDMAFEIQKVEPWDGFFKDWFRKEVPGIGASKKSGVYLIADFEGTILYIGKAAANNLGAEIYGKFSAATQVDKNDTPVFGNSSLAKWAPEDKYQKLIVDGNVLIRAAIIDPKEYSSLAEVYLHIWCERNEGLPPLNKRIG